MDSLWNAEEAEAFSHSELAVRVYTSRLLGRNPDLVMHGGGNTSLKVIEKNLFGDLEEVLYVKGSGWDLKTIEAAGFAATRLNHLKRMATLSTMSDTQMAKELKASQLDPGAPAPSVEAILHAIIPFKFVDHTHTDAVVAISNTPNGEQRIKALFGKRVLVLPYIMPGFILSKQVFDATQSIDWQQLDGIMLLHHGLFTFNDDGRKSYEKMLELVSKAESYLQEVGALSQRARGSYQPCDNDFVTVAELRKAVSQAAGEPMIAQWKLDENSVGFSQITNALALADRGPLTPDHTLYTKRVAARLDENPCEGIRQFVSEYLRYFSQHNDGSLTCLDPAPRYAVWKQRGVMVFGPNIKRVSVVSDITDHTLKAIQWGEAMGGWQALPEKDIFDLEYWELEQAKLKKAAAKALFEGKIVLVTGAASGIGLACVKTFLDQGACVVGLDINPAVINIAKTSAFLGVQCDVTQTDQIKAALQQGIKAFGGLDVVISNAGIFPPSMRLEALTDEQLNKSTELNFSSHVKLMREAIPYLKLGIEPSIIIVASKNVPAPGPGVGAYSAAKAALTQMARVAALELGADNIRVNTLHPNAIFDTGVWTPEILAQRADHYGMSIDEYKRNNVLKTEITSADVALLAATLAGPAFAKTTGAQIPVDGGNDRVI